MKQTLTVSDRVYSRLARGASERGMSVERLLTIVAEIVGPVESTANEDRRRSDRIADLLEQFRVGNLTSSKRKLLEGLIDADLESATARADRMIGKMPLPSNGRGKAKQTQK